MRDGDGGSTGDLTPTTYRWLLFAAFLGGLWLTHKGFLARTPAGTDVMAHVARTDAGMHLLRQGRTDGWFPVFGSGYRLYAVYGPGLTLASAAVRVASLGVVHPARSFAVLGSLSIALLPSTFAVLCREIGLTRRAAVIAGTLSLFVGTAFGGGLAGLYTTGLVPQAVAMPAQLLVLAGLLRIARTGSVRAVAATALGVGWLLILHPISLVVLVFLAPGLLLTVPRPWSGRNLAKAVASGAWGAAVAAFWLLPAFVHRDLRGELSAFDTPALLDRIGDVASGEILYPRVLGVAVAVGLAMALGAATRPGADRRWLAAPVTALAYLLLGHVAVGQEWSPAELWIQLPNRGLTLAGCLLLLPLSVVVADAIGRLREPIALRVTAALTVVLALLAPWILSGPLDPRQSAPAPTPDLQAVGRLLKAEALPPARHLLVAPSPFVPLGTSEPTRWLASASGSPTAQLYFSEATKSPGAGELPEAVLSSVSASQALGPMRRAGITHLVVTTPSPAGQLDGQPGYRLIETDGPLAVYAIEPAPGSPEVADLLQPDGDALRPDGARLDAELEHAEAEDYQWAVRSNRGTEGADGAAVVVAPVAFDPAWQATIDGEEVPVTRSSEGLVRFSIPNGTHEVRLEFTDGGNDPGSLAISAIATTSALIVVVRRRRHRTGGAGSSASVAA